MPVEVAALRRVIGIWCCQLVLDEGGGAQDWTAMRVGGRILINQDEAANGTMR